MAIPADTSSDSDNFKLTLQDTSEPIRLDSLAIDSTIRHCSVQLSDTLIGHD
jgi:hypothetical protein